MYNIFARRCRAVPTTNLIRNLFYFFSINFSRSLHFSPFNVRYSFLSLQTTATSTHIQTPFLLFFYILTAGAHPKDCVIKKKNQQATKREEAGAGNEDMSADITSLWRRCTRAFAAKQMKKRQST